MTTDRRRFTRAGGGDPLARVWVSGRAIGSSMRLSLWSTRWVHFTVKILYPQFLVLVIEETYQSRPCAKYYGSTYVFRQDSLVSGRFVAHSVQMCFASPSSFSDYNTLHIETLSSILRLSFGSPMLILRFSFIRALKSQEVFFDIVLRIFSSKAESFRCETRYAKQ